MGSEARIISVIITPSNSQDRRYQATAVGVFDDDPTPKAVLSWYDDELTFTEADFIGKTRQQVIDLFMQRDKEYLQS